MPKQVGADDQDERPDFEEVLSALLKVDPTGIVGVPNAEKKATKAKKKGGSPTS